MVGVSSGHANQRTAGGGVRRVCESIFNSQTDGGSRVRQPVASKDSSRAMERRKDDKVVMLSGIQIHSGPFCSRKGSTRFCADRGLEGAFDVWRCRKHVGGYAEIVRYFDNQYSMSLRTCLYGILTQTAVNTALMCARHRRHHLYHHRSLQPRAANISIQLYRDIAVC